jgi:hypothetical protein
MKLIVAVIVSVTVVLVSPFMGQLQSFLRRSLSTDNYVLLFGVGVMVAVGLAIAFAFARIRERRLARFGLLLLALTFGGGYMWFTATPWAEVNAVERVHFVEYGMIAFLFYRASLADDISIVILPMLAAFTVGVFDEWLQWFIPVRVGEAHDVFLNLVSIACGLMFALALQPPAAFSIRPGARALRRIGFTAAFAWLVFATFVSQVHLGYFIDEPGAGRFHSHYTSARLFELQQDRAARWLSDPPRTLRRLSREDQYLDEGLWHVRRRNLTGETEAWVENLILERFFVPVLDIPTYASPNGNRWAPEQRADMATRAGNVAAFVSTAEPYPIVTWSKAIYWPVVLLIALLLAGMPRLVARRG